MLKRISARVPNRIDETIVFHMLTGPQEDRRHLKRHLMILAAAIELEFTDNARKQLMDEGFDPAYGARPLKRVIQQRIENPLAGELIAGRFDDGDRIRVEGQEHEFVFEKI